MKIRFEISPKIKAEDLNKLFSESWINFTNRDFNYLDKSLFYVCCFNEQNDLIGFANVAGDGFLHAFLLDVTVLPEHRRNGIASEIVKLAKVHAKKFNIEWLHVDFEKELYEFYAKCGFKETAAGLINLKT